MKRPLLTLALATLCQATPALAIDVHVDAANTTGVEDGSLASPFSTIQAGIDLAVAGDVVLVAPGVYTGAIALRDGIPVRSTQGAGATIIDGAGAWQAVSPPPAGGSRGIISGFTIRNSDQGYLFVMNSPSWSTTYLDIDSCVLERAGTAVRGSMFGHLTMSRTVVRKVQYGLSAAMYGFHALVNVTIDAATVAALAVDQAYVTLHDVAVSSSGGIVLTAGFYENARIDGSNVNVWNTPITLVDYGPGRTAQNYVQNQLAVDPRYVSAPDDLRLQAGSPLIDAGTPHGGINGLPEFPFLGAAPDIGALEFQPDSTAPVTTLALDGLRGDAGWFRSDVTATLSATDEGGSGVAVTEYALGGGGWSTYGAPFGLSAEGTTSLAYRSRDVAGNQEADQAATVSIDKTAPAVTVTTPPAGSPYLLRQPVLAAWSATDPAPGSGLASATGTVPSGAPIDTATVGTKAFEVTALDVAGNGVSQAVTYQVQYRFGGLQPPLAGTTTPTFRRGETVQVRFTLLDDAWALVGTAQAWLFVAPVVGGVVGVEQPAVPSGGGWSGNAFRYDARNRRYVYPMSTSSLAPGTWQLRIALDDGTSQTKRISVRR